MSVCCFYFMPQRKSHACEKREDESEGSSFNVTAVIGTDRRVKGGMTTPISRIVFGRS